MTARGLFLAAFVNIVILDVPEAEYSPENRDSTVANSTSTDTTLPVNFFAL